jgi:hypothetical protein
LGAIWWLVVGGAHLSIASWGEDRVGSRGRPAGHLSCGPSCGQRQWVGPCRAEGAWVVSRCQMASASLRASSRRATAGPAGCRGHLAGGLVVVAMDRVAGGMVAASMSAQRR